MRDSISARISALKSKFREQRGAVLIVVAGGMLALTSVVALAVDVGLMTTARLEAQRAADAAALAGAGAFVGSPGNELLARQLATDFASYNDVRFDAVQLQDDDISIDRDALKVSVWVYRNRDRGNAIPTFFARVFGINEVNIAAMATAEAAPAGGIQCLLPIAVPDRWHEAGGPGNNANTYDPDDGDYYIPWIETNADNVQYNEGFTGYSEADLGMQIPLKSNTSTTGLNPSWYYPWRPPYQMGADDYRTNVDTCVDGYQGSIDPSKCRQSPRVRPVPLFDPRESPDLGSKPFTFTNFVGMFVEKIEGKTVYGRWLGYTGIKPAAPDEATTAGPLFKVLRLVE
jgi:hypothetical protein